MDRYAQSAKPTESPSHRLRTTTQPFPIAIGGNANNVVRLSVVGIDGKGLEDSDGREHVARLSNSSEIVVKPMERRRSAAAQQEEGACG